MLLASGCGQAQKDEQVTDRPRAEIAVLTALPLFWQEGAFGSAVGGEDRRAEIIRSLEKNGKVRPLDAIEGPALDGVGLLILAQPRLLSPDELVRIDEWVRGGGHVIAFADPMLDWPSTLPMGDARRAPPVTLLDPLFQHWGLELDGGTDSHTETRSLSGVSIETRGSGRWRATAKTCDIEKDALVARCALGKGSAVLVADADVLNDGAGESVSLVVSEPMAAALKLIETEAKTAG